MKAKAIHIKTVTDQRGSLSFLENSVTGGEIPFRYKRVFWIYNVPEGAERGGHAHCTCSELFIAVHGTCDIELNDGVTTAVVHLCSPDKAVEIPAMTWCRLYNFSTDFVGLCLASQHYTSSGYIHDFERFVQEARSREAEKAAKDTGKAQE